MKRQLVASLSEAAGKRTDEHKNGVTHCAIFSAMFLTAYAFRDFIIFLLLYEVQKSAWKRPAMFTGSSIFWHGKSRYIYIYTVLVSKILQVLSFEKFVDFFKLIIIFDYIQAKL